MSFGLAAPDQSGASDIQTLLPCKPLLVTSRAARLLRWCNALPLAHKQRLAARRHPRGVYRLRCSPSRPWHSGVAGAAVAPDAARAAVFRLCSARRSRCGTRCIRCGAAHAARRAAVQKILSRSGPTKPDRLEGRYQTSRSANLSRVCVSGRVLSSQLYCALTASYACCSRYSLGKLLRAQFAEIQLISLSLDLFIRDRIILARAFRGSRLHDYQPAGSTSTHVYDSILSDAETVDTL